MKNLRFFKERGKALRHLLGKKQLATFAAILCMMAMMPLTARAQTVYTTITSEQLTNSSTVYVGEVVVDGVSEIKYLYSGDVTLAGAVQENLLDGLQGMADGDYAALLQANWPNASSAPQSFAFCSNSEYAAAMDANWSSAQYVGTLYYPGKTVTNEVNSNLYDIDNGFKAFVDEQTEFRIANINNPIDVEKSIVSYLSVSETDNVYWVDEGGQHIKHVDTYITYSSEATTVIYTKVELETPFGPFDPYTTPLTFEAVEDGTINIDNPNTLTIEYNKNNSGWTSANTDPISITVAAGDVVQFRGDNASYWATGDSGETVTRFTATNPVYVYGNVMSLIDKDDFPTNTTLTGEFSLAYLFAAPSNDIYQFYANNSTILNHPNKDLMLPATTLSETCYGYMFAGCEGLTRAPELPATTLAMGCYHQMFADCSGLTEAPSLPATTLAQHCYSSMFYNCTGLTVAPDLPALTLPNGCYYGMFNGCTSLNYVKCLGMFVYGDDNTTDWLGNVAASGTFIKAIGMNWTLNSPNGIPAGWTVEDDPYTEPLTFEAMGTALIYFKTNGHYATDLMVRTYSNGTWSNWQYGETNKNYFLYSTGDKIQFIKENTEPLATGVYNYCYFQTSWNNCYVYGNIMSLFNFETTLEDSYACCKLFDGNTKITNYPTKDLILGATTLSDNCYMYMFRGCTGLTRIPELPATTLANKCYYDMFRECTALNTKPVLPATTLAYNCYRGMFQGCTALTTPPDLPATTLAESCYGAMFADCTNLQAAPELPATTLEVACYGSMFSGCTSLTTAPELPATTLATDCYNHMFDGCIGLTATPELPATTMAHKCYYYMFYGCTNLTSAPALPSTELATWCYNGMFYNCANLAEAPVLPATTLFEQCYADMFHGTSLATAPVLPATTLAKECYAYMFSQCSNLNYVKCLATDISADNCTLNWLADVSSTGTFVKANGTNWTLDNPSGIPEGWTVESIDVFTTEGNWDVASNWSGNAIPDAGSDVVIAANATIPENYVANAGEISINDGATLTIADGGQLIHSNAVNATLQKEIVGFGNDNSVPTGWYTIASPLTEDFTPTDDMLTDVYDLYYYDEPNALWKNHKQNSFVIEPQKGYLYANSNNKTLAFTGEMQATTNTVAVPLSYMADGNLKGYNLVGNPFTCNVTGDITLGGAALTSYYIADGSVTNEGANLIACNIVDRAIKPGEGFFVQATAANQDLVFNPAAKGEAATKPAFICIEAGNDSFMDRAYVQIGQGNTLRKMSLNDNTAKVYVMDDGKDYAAATIEAAEGEMPVHFKAAKNGTYTINVNAENLDLAYLHLIDNLTGADVDLLENPSYTFMAKTSDYASRFRLVFSNSGDAVGDNDMPFAFVNNGNIIVNGEGTLQVMDVLGHVIHTRTVTPNSSLPTPNSLGVYVLRLINGDDVKTQKIVIK